MNEIQRTKPLGLKRNWLLGEVVTILHYMKHTIYHAISIKVFTDGTVSWLFVYTEDFLNTTTNVTESPKIRRVFGESFEMKFQEGSVLKYLNSLIFQYPHDFSVDKIDHIIEIVY